MRRGVGALLLLVIIGTMTCEQNFAPVTPPIIHQRRADKAVAPQPRKRDSSVPQTFKEYPLRYLAEAPVDSLILLPGIGPVIAENIASARSGKRLFTRWDDLLTIKGIGPKKLERLRTLATSED